MGRDIDWRDGADSALAGTDDRHLRLSLLEVVFGQARINMLLSPLVAALLCTALWSASEHERLLIWLGTVTFAYAVRFLVATGFHRSQPVADIRLWERLFAASLILASLSWGLGVLYILPAESDFHRAVAYLFLIGMGGGSALSYAAADRTAILALYACLAPVTVLFLTSTEPAYLGMGLAGVVLAAVATNAIRRLGGFIRRSFELSVEIERARQEADRRARTDDLTGLLNRGAFYEMGNYLITQAERDGRPLTLLLIDVDHFKQVNDVHGHAAGDSVLCTLTALIRESGRAVDVVGRLGGDEFAILLPDAALAEAIGCADRFRQNLAGMPTPVAGLERQVTCSMGVAEYAKGESLDDLFADADDALYRSKRGGRDRVSAGAQAPATTSRC